MTNSCLSYEINIVICNHPQHIHRIIYIDIYNYVQLMTECIKRAYSLAETRARLQNEIFNKVNRRLYTFT